MDNNDLGGISGSREPSPTVSALTGFDPGRVVDAFNKRLAIYWRKMDQSDALAEDSYNRREAFQLVVEAIEILAREAGFAVADESADA